MGVARGCSGLMCKYKLSMLLRVFCGDVPVNGDDAIDSVLLHFWQVCTCAIVDQSTLKNEKEVKSHMSRGSRLFDSDLMLHANRPFFIVRLTTVPHVYGVSRAS